MAQTKQQLKLMLSERELSVFRVKKNGKEMGKRTRWTVGRKSLLPKALYFLIHSFVRSKINHTEDRSFHSLEKAVRTALRQAGEACGCRVEFGGHGGDVCWYLHGEPFFAFQIHEVTLGEKAAKRLRKGQALLRWVITVAASGMVRYHPRKTRRD